MRERVERLLRGPGVRGAGDVLVALLLVATSVVPVLGGDPSWGRPVPLGLALAVASTAPIAVRNRWPLSVAAVVLVANGACAYAAAPLQAAFQPFVSLVLAAYTVGNRAEGRRAAWLAPALAVAALPIFVAAVLHGQDPGNAIPSYVWLVAAWVVGRVVRGWRHKTVELQAANRELAESRELQAQAAVMVERGRIARELHDVVAHNVSMMVVQAGAAVRVLAGDQPDVHNALEVIAETGRQTVDEMRTLLGVLRADSRATLGPQPGLADLDQLVAGVREAGLPVRLRVEGDPCALPRMLDLSAYRIVQEALTNTLKHAGQARAEIVLRYGDGRIELTITDTATAAKPAVTDVPAPTATPGAGHGLVGMRERVAMLGGELEAAPTADGFVVRARLAVTRAPVGAPLADATPLGVPPVTAPAGA